LPSRQRARRTNDPLADINMNTARGRRTADLVRAYMRAAGNPKEPERQATVITAAELQVLAEEARAAALAGTGTVDLDQVIRVQGAADRAVRRLGIKPPVERSDGPTLDAYLNARYGQHDEAHDVEERTDATIEPAEAASETLTHDDGNATASLAPDDKAST
jgi:hypothetical protein